jgi:uncharacterized membrane protein
MNIRFYIICIAAVLALVLPAAADNSTATVHGEVYSWDTFEPLENAVVNVNSTPSQSMVAKYGMYSFELEPGNYSITARYYQNNTITYSAAETVTIKGGGSYVLDILLLPVYSEELMDGSEVNVSSKNSTSSAGNPITGAAAGKINTSKGVNISEQSGFNSTTVNYLLISLAFFLLLAAGYRIFGKHKEAEKNVPQKQKTRPTTGDSSGIGNTQELSVKVPAKSIEPEVRPNFQVNTDETASAAEQVTELKSKIHGTEPVTESEPKIPMMGPVIEQESRIPERKTSAESKEVYPAQKKELPPQETELEVFEPEEEDQKTSLEELSDDPEIEIISLKKKLPLPTDLQEVMDIIRGHGGRITQKDLRSRLKYSEGKVSLMLADLERRELIEKFKRGRGNVVILIDEKR